MPDIKLTNVLKNYGSGVNALDDLSLTINDGDFMCLLGPSGCGKTTTVRMIAGLEHATDGQIAIGERVVDEPSAGKFISPEQREVGMVFQSYALWPHLTVGQNIEYGLKLKKQNKGKVQSTVERVADKLGIDQHLDRYPAQLSGGQQQRVALARMLAVNPQLMLLDEPLSNLDSRLRLEMRAELKRIHNDFASTIVFVTHDQWEAMTLATRVAVLHDGRLQQVGSPTDIYDRPANRFVANFLGSPPINFVEHSAGSLGGQTFKELQRLYPDAYPLTRSLGLRPESIVLKDSDHKQSEDEFGLQAKVVSVMPTGGNNTIELEIDKHRIYATALDARGITAGDMKKIVAPKRKLHLFGSDERRITDTDA